MNRRVLIIQDDPALIEVLKQYYRSCEVHVATDAATGGLMLAEGNWWTVELDHDLDRCTTGWEVLASLRSGLTGRLILHTADPYTGHRMLEVAQCSGHCKAEYRSLLDLDWDRRPEGDLNADRR